MTSANLDLVRSIYADWERGDFGSVDWAHPEIEFVVADGIEPGTWKGRTGMANAWRTRLSAWNDVRIESEEYRELDEEGVLVTYQPTGRGKASGVDLGQLPSPGVLLFHIRDETVTRFVIHNEGDRALADLGLEE